MLEIGREIERYGTEAVTGRKVLSARLVRDINMAMNISNAYTARDRYRDEDGERNEARWSMDNPEAARSLQKAEENWIKQNG